MQRTLSLLAGIISGLIVGAVAALLFAPESGSELRLQTRDWVNTALDEARQAAQAKRIELNERFTALKQGDESPHSS